MDLIFFLFRLIAAFADRMRSKWRYLLVFLLTDALLIFALLVDAIYSTAFHERIGRIADLFTTATGGLVLLGAGLAGAIGVRLLIALKL